MGKRAMDLTIQQIRYLRLYKQGLIAPFETLDQLFAALEIQAQNESDAFFNVNRRLAKAATAEEVQQAAIRVWYVRNTIFLMGKRYYEKAVFINNVIDNWFRRTKITTAKDEADLQHIIDVCQDRDFVSVDELEKLGCNRSFIRAWSGAFIELVRRGVLRSKYKKRLEINHSPVRADITMEDVMRAYFDVYGPATLRDFKHWLGKTAPEVNPTFDRIQGEYIQVNGKMLLPRKDLALLAAATEIPVIITGKFDPICLNYQDKSWLVDGEHNHKVWGKAGIVEAVILIDGAISATWRKDKAGVRVCPIQKLTKLQQRKIIAQFHKLFGKTAKIQFQST